VSIPACGKGTRKGEVAQNSRYGFSACVLSLDHGGPCDSGPALAEQRSFMTSEFAARKTSIEP
jgi:hypothetical protein